MPGAPRASAPRGCRADALRTKPKQTGIFTLSGRGVGGGAVVAAVAWHDDGADEAHAAHTWPRRWWLQARCAGAASGCGGARTFRLRRDEARVDGAGSGAHGVESVPRSCASPGQSWRGASRAPQQPDARFAQWSLRCHLQDALREMAKILSLLESGGERWGFPPGSAKHPDSNTAAPVNTCSADPTASIQVSLGT
jgi:hypothetical protein